METDTIFATGAHYVLIWVGFGTIVGLLAKAIMPGRDPGGALATVIIGIMGSIIGAGTLMFFSSNLRVTPISALGFVVALGGTSVLLFSYRLLNGNLFKEGMPKWKFKRQTGRHKVIVEE